MWKIAEMIGLSDFENPVTYYPLRRKGRATYKSVEGAQPLEARCEATSLYYFNNEKLNFSNRYIVFQIGITLYINS